MKKRENFYKVTRNDNFFTATHNDYIMFKGRAKELRQYGIALIAINSRGKYDLYLPVKKRAYNCNFFDCNQGCLCVLKNISSYQYFNGLFLLRMKRCCFFIYPESFSFFLSNPGVLNGRKRNLPKVYFSGDYKRAKIVKKRSKTNNYICQIDERLYDVKKIFTSVDSTKSQLSVTEK